MKKSKLSKRITWRVIVIMLCFNVLIIAAILVFVFGYSLANSGMRGQYVTDGIDGRLESSVKAVKIAARNNVEEVEDNLDTPQTVFDALEHELRLNNSYIGFAAAFEPNYYPSEGYWFEPYVILTDSNHIERKQIGSAQHDYFNTEWYINGMQDDKGEGYLSDPYYDAEGGMSLLCSYILPIRDAKGEKVGLYCIDMSLDWLKTIIEEDLENVKKEFFSDSNHIGVSDKTPYFSIQIIDSKGHNIIGSDSLDTSILKGEKRESVVGLEMQNLIGTPYYVHTRQIAGTDWTLAVFQHRNLVFMGGKVLALVIIFFMTLGALVIFFFMHRSIHSAIKPLGYLSESSCQVAKGNFDTPLPTFEYDDEIKQLRDSFDSMQHSLKHYVKELKETVTSKASMESELNIAHHIQMAMLPKTFPAFPHRNDIEIYGMLTPAKSVGGDLYDFMLRDDELFFCIGDVSGKGVPASLVMAVSRTLFRNVAVNVDKPHLIVEAMNKSICDGNDSSMFVTLFVGVLDLATGHLRYCNAGHNPPYLQNKLVASDPNFPVGAIPDWEFIEEETDIAPGETLFLYTDGLTEAENANHDEFGEQRVEEIIASSLAAGDSPKQMIDNMTAAVTQFVGDTEQSDDLTMLAFRYNKL